VKRVLATVLLLSGVAYADPLVTPPAGWKQDPQQANALAAKTNEVSHFGGLRSLATSDVYVAPEGGAALIVTAVAGKVASADRDAAARIAIDELNEATKRAVLAGSGAAGVTVDSSASNVVADQKAVRGDLQWTDKSSGTQTHAVILIVADDENIVAITGECVGQTGAVPAACIGALATLNPGISLDKRQPISLAAPGTALTSPGLERVTQMPTMTDGTHTPLPPMTVPTEKPATDRRPVYVGLGIVLLAAAFWWNQRRRAKFEKDSDDE
jgi:hypothetical protein